MRRLLSAAQVRPWLKIALAVIIVAAIVLGAIAASEEKEEAKRQPREPAAPTLDKRPSAGAALDAGAPIDAGPEIDTSDAEIEALDRKAAAGEQFTDYDRKRVAVKVTKFFRKNDFPVAFQASGTALYVVDLSGGSCNRRVLKLFDDDAEFHGAVVASGFTKLRCSPDGPDLVLTKRNAAPK